MIGFPNETKIDRDLTRNLMVDIGFDWNQILVATPFKGSRLYEICIKNGYIDESYSLTLDTRKCVITAPGVEPEKITREAYLMNLDVNFVNNHNFAQGYYDKAFLYFNRILNKFPDHAFAYYFAAECLKKIENGDKTLVKNYFEKYDIILEKDEIWRKYAEHFNIGHSLDLNYD
jgi:tetratricopeptide (TPR) repeat protein